MHGAWSLDSRWAKMCGTKCAEPWLANLAVCLTPLVHMSHSSVPPCRPGDHPAVELPPRGCDPPRAGAPSGLQAPHRSTVCHSPPHPCIGCMLGRPPLMCTRGGRAAGSQQCHHSLCSSCPPTALFPPIRCKITGGAAGPGAAPGGGGSGGGRLPRAAGAARPWCCPSPACLPALLRGLALGTNKHDCS